MEKKSRLTVDVVTGREFVGNSVSDVQWLPDSSAITFIKSDCIFRHNVLTGEESMILDSDIHCKDEQVEMSGYHTTGQQNILLITGKQKQIWRYSFAAPYYLYDIPNKTIFSLANGDPDLQNVALSPDNKHVAYVKASNLFVASCTPEGNIKQLTFDGSDDILNGIFDWVYEEEFQRADAFRWSPDGSKIAFWWTNQARVKSFTLIDDVSQRYPKITNLKYPKVGELNAIVKVGVVNIHTGDLKWMDIGKEEDIYIPRIDWTTSSDVLCIQRLNRKQNFLEILFADVNTSITKVILTDENKKGWIDITDDFIFFKKKNEFLWTSEKSGYREIYHSDYSGQQIKQVTTLNVEITSVIGFHEDSGWIYFYGKYSGLQNQCVYRIHLDGTQLELVSESSGWTTAKFSPDYSYYFSDRSAANIPNQYSLYSSSGKKMKVLEENKIPAMDQYELNFPEFTEIEVDDGNGSKIKLSAYFVKPPNFDPHKKYPVIIYGYSGPATQMVIDRWIRQRILWHSQLVSMGAIVFCVDHRGSCARGSDFKNAAYLDLSQYAVKDQISAVKYLRSLSYVDATRIAIWGWSGGGYLACMLLLRGPEYYRCGIAVAPVSDFRNYDTIWTERYMGLPHENEAGYKAADVLTYTQYLQNPLLLVHGSGDDNVHAQNTMMLVDKLIAANKQFELMIYPNRNHGIYGNNATRHLFTMMTNFLCRNLNLQ